MIKKRTIFLGLLIVSTVLESKCNHISKDIQTQKIAAKKSKDKQRNKIIFYTFIKKYKNKAINFIKKHPFITSLIVVTFLSKNLRTKLFRTPLAILDDINSNPFTSATIGGIILWYIVGA
ncbi:hypothetical protein KAH94_02190 [bacterium]|nr:hypothetical protein [bacterium]